MGSGTACIMAAENNKTSGAHRGEIRQGLGNPVHIAKVLHGDIRLKVFL